MTKYAIAALVLVLVLWGWLRAFAYFDPLAFCRIHIDVELLEGDRAPIRRAVNLVRREDPLAYHALCRYVDRIVEEPRCQAGDPQADPALRGQLARVMVSVLPWRSVIEASAEARKPWMRS